MYYNIISLEKVYGHQSQNEKINNFAVRKWIFNCKKY